MTISAAFPAPTASVSVMTSVPLFTIPFRGLPFVKRLLGVTLFERHVSVCIFGGAGLTDGKGREPLRSNGAGLEEGVVFPLWWQHPSGEVGGL